MPLTKKMHKKLMDEYDSLLRSTGREGIEELLEWLHGTDFYTAPARAEHGCSYPGGLLEHSLDVYHCLHEKLIPGASSAWNSIAADPDVTEESVIISTLLHDLCKIGIFFVTRVNRKNYDPDVVAKAEKWSVKQDKDGQFIWEAVPGYRLDETMPLGRGEKSVILAQRYIRLTDAEMYAIRWHNGFYEADDKWMVSNVMAAYPLVLGLYEADLEATYITEKNKLRKA